MNVKITQGSVKFNDKVFLTGEVVDLPEETVKVLLREKVAELVQVVAKEEKPKVGRKAKEVKVAPVEEKKDEIKTTTTSTDVVVEVTTDWTRKELNDYAASKGIVGAEKMYTKQEVVDAIKGVK